MLPTRNHTKEQHMDVSILTIINLMREQGLKPGKGHLQPTEHAHQSIYFNQRTNTRVIIESNKESISLWIIPTNIVIPTENLIENFDKQLCNLDFVSDPNFILWINTFTDEEDKKLLTMLIELTVAGRGKAIVIS